ncbi:ABC transporter ATP-binding protein [Flavimobilis sp. GY10621]|uniref:ABC transporter ATP-binding protein n=1 Tax=Flavimobilis rhizosphaerae TaxID=2775421 RepID=A0ABR9DTF7_9MICO|nr:ABC transporter ATP-binding protein [Flavimobilis rhizosphaerae]MBD9699280.1 ABC transporter ATP-binding protein [Flavimobilis rhizosphaerae]
MTDAALTLTDLRVTAGARTIIDGLDLTVQRGRTLGVVGESGSGKTMLVRALTGLLPAGVAATGTYELTGARVDLTGSPRAWARVRGRRIVLVLQDPFTSLDPMQRCGTQILAGRSGEQGLRAVRGRRADRDAEVARRLAEVGLPAHVGRQYPHELSGGMRQRVALAAALAADPDVLLADEPTTALDVTTQREILDLLARVQAARGMTVVLITHDLALARERCDDLVVVRAGEIVERGPAREVFENPQHPYTRQLHDAAAGRLREGAVVGDGALLRVEGLRKTFHGASAPAVDDVSLTVAPGECVGVVGESGSGKTTVARIVVGLETADAGRVVFAGDGGAAGAECVASRASGTGASGTSSSASAERRRAERRRGHRGTGRDPRDVQIVFQDPYSALNPALTVGAMLDEALAVGPRTRTVSELLTMVGLPTSYARRLPARLSGGERQRVAIARALAPEPRLLVCDESVSALDVSVQEQILDLLAALRRDLGLTILFISHDLTVMQQVTDRVYVMRSGRVVESGPTSRVLAEPEHPYTRSLLAAVPGAPIPSTPLPPPSDS